MGLRVLFLGLALALGLGGFSPLARGQQDPPSPEGMFDLYELNRKQGLPNYITEDFILRVYGMVLGNAVTVLEKEHLKPEFQNLVQALTELVKQKKQSDPIVQSNLDFLGVIGALLKGQDQAPDAAHPDLAAKEIRRIKKAEGIQVSDLMFQSLDYTRFKPRGHYAAREDLARYFRALRYAQMVLFPVLDSRATGISPEIANRLTAEAEMLVGLIMDHPEVRDRYQALLSVMARLFGPAEDLSAADLAQARLDHPKAGRAELRTILFQKAVELERRPVILSGTVNASRLEPERTASDVLTGWRFIPQSRTPDAAAFQELVFDRVKDYQGVKEAPFSLTIIQGRKVKGFPLAMELAALLGSNTAQEEIEAGDETSYLGYPEAASKAKAHLTSSQGIPGGHIQILSYWLSRESEDPLRNLNTALGFWTGLRHLSLLYARQGTTVGSKSVDLSADPKRDFAWIEPAPELYGHLENQVAEFQGILDNPALTRFRGLLGRCRAIASKELRKEEPNPGDADFLNRLDLEFLKLTGAKDGPLIVDVHTVPAVGLVLEEGLGRPRVVTATMNDREARGALFSFFEFKQDMNHRLTDAEWAALLADRKKSDALGLSSASTSFNPNRNMGMGK